jgi:long-chain acyl-CoA synthetase
MENAVGPAPPTFSGAVLGRVDYLEAFLRQVEARPDAVAVEIYGTRRRTTYAQLLALAEGYRGLLQRQGVQPGDYVALCLPSGAEFLAAWLALTSLYAVAVPLSPMLRPGELRAMLVDARPVGLVTVEGLDLADLCAGLPGEGQPFVVTTPPTDGHGRSSLAAFEAAKNPIVSCHFTYKGLGYPLGVLHRYQDYGYTIAAGHYRFAAQAGGTYLSLLPMYPLYGLSFSLDLLAQGSRLLILPRPGEVDLYRLLVDEQIQLTALVPVLLRRLIAAVLATGSRKALGLHPDLEIACSASLLVPSLAIKAAEVVGIECCRGYGSTETMPIVGGFPGWMSSDALGYPVHPEAVVEVVDGEGQPVATGQTGSIVASGPMVFEGYLGHREATSQFLRQGRCFTGDLGHFDQQGALHYDGRGLPFTKCSSQMVDLTEVELVATKHPAVAHARATVRLDPQWDETLGLSVVLHPGQQATEAELRTFCGRHLSRHKVPRTVRVYQRDQIPVALEARSA